MMKKPFSLAEFRNKSVHIVGVTGSEGSAILRLLTQEKFKNITVHDYSPLEYSERSFKVWHKGIPLRDRNNAFKIFAQDIKTVNKNFGNDYLKEIESGDIIFAPQSWRLYKRQNVPLLEAHQKGILFCSLTSLYLDLSPAKVIAVCGTVGKGSVSHLIYDVLKGSGKSVYYGGNDTWNIQSLENITSLSREDYLVLEVSHRQLQEGLQKGPFIGVLTNIYPNHLDETGLEEYKKLKYSLFTSQLSSDFAVLNNDYKDISDLAKEIKSQAVFFSTKDLKLNTKYVQIIYDYFMRNKSNHLIENIIATGAVLELLNISVEQTIKEISSSKSLQARMQKIAENGEIEWYDDVKSTTPWATLALINKLGNNLILIMGGKTKGIDYKDALKEIQKRVLKLIILESELRSEASKYLMPGSYMIAGTLKDALALSYKEAKKGTKIAVSPGAAFFYTDFIKGKSSIRQILYNL